MRGIFLQCAGGARNKFLVWLTAGLCIVQPFFVSAQAGDTVAADAGLPVQVLAKGSVVFCPLGKMEKQGIKISAMPGVYDAGLRLSFQLPGGTELFFIRNSETGSFTEKYAGSLTLDTVTNLQCTLTKNGKPTDTIYCGTYVIGCSHTLPVLCLSVNPAEFFAPTGIYYGYSEVVDGSVVAHGNSWAKKEINCFAEFLFGGRMVEKGHFGLRTHGCYTLGHPEKSLQLIARKKFGQKKMNGRFFPDRPFNEYKKIIIRTSGNEQSATRFKDVFISSLAKDMAVDYMAWQPAVVYVNGIYWGIHNLREKVGMDYLEYNHGAHPDSTVLLEGGGGRNKDYKALIKFVKDHNQDQDFPKTVEEKMDVEQYFNYTILQIFNANPDSKGNIKFWKDSLGDGRFHWIFYDGDCSCGLDYVRRKNFLADRLSPVETVWYNSPSVTVLLRSLVANTELKYRFINQYCMLMSTLLNPDSLCSRLDRFKAVYEPEIPRHVTRRNNVRHESVHFWNSHVKNLKYFYSHMPARTYSQLKEQFALGDTVRISIGTATPGLKGIRINGSRLRFEKVEGLFFENLPLLIEADAGDHRYRFIKWQEDEDTRPQRKVIIKKNLKYTAEYAVKDSSELAGDLIICRYYICMQTKKNFYWLEIRNAGCRARELKGCTLYEDMAGWSYSFGDMILPSNTSVIISSDTSYFRERNPGFPGLLIQSVNSLVFRQDYRFVLCDALDRLAGCVELQIPDSLLMRKNHFLITMVDGNPKYKTWNNDKKSINWGKEIVAGCAGIGGFSATVMYIAAGALITAVLITLFIILIIRKKRKKKEAITCDHDTSS